jgi:hypothetical protein
VWQTEEGEKRFLRLLSFNIKRAKKENEF